MKPTYVRPLTEQQLAELDKLYRTTKVPHGLGAVSYHTGETVVIIRRQKRRREVAELLQLLVDKHHTGTIYVAWDNANTHQDDEVEAVIRAAAGRLVLLHLPTYSPWLNPIEMLWRHFRREATHCELYATVKDLLAASRDFFERHNQVPERVRSIIGSQSIRQNFCVCTWSERADCDHLPSLLISRRSSSSTIR